MKIAYIISAYKYPSLLARLVHRLHTPTSIFLIHVDKRTSDHEYHDMVTGVSDLDNVVFLKRHNCRWGDFGHVRATLKGLAYIFENKLEFGYVFLLTGQDYPIKSNSYIESFLNKTYRKEFIAHYSFPNKSWEGGGVWRYEFWHFPAFKDSRLRILRKLAQLPLTIQTSSKTKLAISLAINKVFRKRTFPRDIRPFGGPGYWCITGECAQYIYQFVKANPLYVKFFKYSYISDEIFFHTIVMNSNLASNVVNDDLRCIDISAGMGPKIWQKQDFETLCQSGALIARKFDMSVDFEILDLIDSKLLQAEISIAD